MSDAPPADTDAIKLEPEEVAHLAHLRYYTDNKPGWTRKATKDGFDFFDLHGKPVTDEDEIKRIRSLAIPPATPTCGSAPARTGISRPRAAMPRAVNNTATTQSGARRQTPINTGA